MHPLEALTVVEFAGSLAGAQTARLFGLGGAEVTVIGPDGLAPHQRTYVRQGLRVVSDASGIDWSQVDVIIDSSAPGPIAPRVIDAPHAVRVRMSPFGDEGPRASWLSSDLVDYAVGGHSYLYGHPDRAPLPGPPGQPAIATGLFGFIGAMAALFERDATGRAATVDVNHAQVMAALHQVTLLRWTLTGDVFRRMGNRYTGAGQPNGPYRCRDGTISIVGVTEPQVDGLLAVTGLTHLLDDPRISSSLDFYNHPELLDAPLRDWLADQAVDEVVDLFQAMRIPACPLRTPIELLDDPQLVNREFFVPAVSDPHVQVPGTPFTFSHEQAVTAEAWKPARRAPSEEGEIGPLDGLVVLDLTRVWAGPLCARILADLGADVIQVEAPWARGPRNIPQSMLDATRYFPHDDPGEQQWNRNGHIVKYGLGKRSLAIDLQRPEGRHAFERLVPTAHVVIENFSSRVMPQLGFDETRLHELAPHLVYLTMPGYGRSGPAEHWLAYGSCIDSHAGLSALTGYTDATPWKGGIAWPDPVAGLTACAALLMRIWAGARGSGGGCTIEVAQFEATVAAIGDQIVGAQVDGPWQPARTTAGANCSAIEGTYRCLGDDAWLAVTVLDEAEATAVLDLAARRLAHPPGSVDEALTALAAQADASSLAHDLQAGGVAAGPVHAAPALLDDPHLAAVDAWVTIDQPEIGSFTTAATPLHLSTGGVGVRRPAPTLGEHNADVLLAAGLTTSQISALSDAGVIATKPPR